MSSRTSFPEEHLPWLRLTLVPGISPAVQRGLLQKYGSPQRVLDAPAMEIAQFAGGDIARRLGEGPQASQLDRTLQWLAGADRYLLALGDPGYPKLLLDTCDPPTVLYAVGRIELLNRPSIAIVGSRNATPQGMRDAKAFALALSHEGHCIVSGLAMGVDAAAHRGGLEARGSSVAVTGTGADIVYPKGNHDLALELARRGCLISEFPLGTPSASGNFPRRNRLISGLSRGVLVVEAARESGSLITARFALEQGRDIFAIPGSIHSPLSKGCHDLIKQGAKLVENAADVLEELGEVRLPVGDNGLRSQALPPHPLVEAMGFAPVSVDQLAQHTGLAAATIAAQLSQLEIEGRVSPLAGGRFQRCERIE